MRAVRFNATIPRYVFTLAASRAWKNAYTKGPLCTTRLEDVPVPELPNEEWVRVRTVYGGVCGSDLNLIYLKNSTYSEPYTTMPITLGHENVGVIDKVGRRVEGYSVGDRVVVDPMMPCEARGIDPPCDRCAERDYSQCLNTRQGSIPPGFYMGFSAAAGGSWAESFLAHKSQLMRVPDAMSDEEAVLLEPLTIPLHAVMRNLPAPGDTVLVYGCGIIGMLSVASLKALVPECRVIAVARYGFQADIARGYGVDEVIMQRDVDDLYAEVARLTGAQVLKPTIGRGFLNGGPAMSLECVGSPDVLDDCLRMTRPGGTLVIVGAVGLAPGIDWTPIWFKELKVTGTLCSAADTFDGRTMKTFEWALDLVTSGKVKLDHLLTHVWDLEEYEAMLETARTKGDTGCVKQAFRFKGV